MARKLIEHARRRADVDIEDCVPITLSDGQDWYFPRPWIAVVPIVRGKEAVAQATHVTFGDDLDILLEAIAAEEDPILRIRYVVTLAIFLLDRNYDLESDDYQKILVYRVGDPASDDMIRAIVDASLGTLFGKFGVRAVQDPKASGAGCV